MAPPRDPGLAPPHRDAVPYQARLFARLRGIMAGATELEPRLSGLVRLVSAELVVEVCSIYVLRPGEILELRATEGLAHGAVGRTRLRVGEGIVGIAAAERRALNLPDAQNHPAFAVRPETGEAPYVSMLAVPVVRGGSVLGVIAVQSRATRLYAQDEVEAIETVAMLLAEVLGSGAAASPASRPLALNSALPRHYSGVGLTPGIAMGPVFAHGFTRVAAPVLSGDVLAEQARLDVAIRSMRLRLDALLDGAGTGAAREVLDVHRLLAADAGWLARIEEAVRSGLTAEAATERVLAELRARMRGVADPYLRERIADIEDVAGRLMAELSGGAAPADLPRGFLLVARRLGPADLLEYHAAGLAGLVLEEGSPTAHATIIARALEVPLVAGCRGATEAVVAGETAILDAGEGRLVLHPDADLAAVYEGAIASAAVRRGALALLRDVEPRTLDGVRVQVMVNAGLAMDMAQLEATGADGVGLFRTEIAWLAQGGLPEMEAEEAFYTGIVQAARGRPVLFRTIDLGGDKLLPGFDHGTEENPAMGWRSLRIGLDRPALLRRQLRALLRANAGGTLRVMFPMVTTVEELRAAKKLLRLETSVARKAGRAPVQVLTGAMLEVPALLFQLPALLDEIDFLSIGSNDLTQFLFAADRGNAQVAQRYDFLSAPMLDVVDLVAAAGRAASVPVGLCGEAASRPLEALASLAVGVTSVSMPAISVPSVKAMVRALDLSALRAFMAELRRSARGGGSLRPALTAYAKDHGIPV